MDEAKAAASKGLATAVEQNLRTSLLTQHTQLCRKLTKTEYTEFYLHANCYLTCYIVSLSVKFHKGSTLISVVFSTVVWSNTLFYQMCTSGVGIIGGI